MSKISILPEILSNKIAAGEVVERPASAVKELVENALDAGSDRITIEVEKGGRSLIRISDNGAGMSRDDALLSLERYATSKIRTDDDLFSIGTLGFRGEALPSIASVSRFTLVSRDEASASGVEIIVQGGKFLKVLETGAPKGTMVTVRDLFYNTPARRKFLKTVNTEMGHISDAAARMALGRPDVHFKVIHNDRTLKNWPAASDPRDRVADVVGKETANSLYPMDFSQNGITATGWAASSRISRRTSSGIHLFVNDRFVKDRMVQHALFEGYSGRLMKGRFPVAILFVRLPFDQVDVNVHPTKSEVRFANRQAVHGVIKAACIRAIREEDRPNPPSRDYPLPSLDEGVGRIAETVTPYETSPPRPVNRPPFSAPSDSRPGTPIPFPSPAERPAAPPRLEPDPAPPAQQAPIWDEKRFTGARVIGQFHNTYILCESSEGLILIDQHAAHERILFEQLRDRARGSKGASQGLLLPETFDVGFGEAEILNDLIPSLTDLGFDIAPFGGSTFVVSAVPAPLASREIEPLIRDLVDKTAEFGVNNDPGKILEEALILMACHGAIRANQSLSHDQIKALFEQLDACENPSNCPHGRPTWLKWSLGSLEKQFRRIV